MVWEATIVLCGEPIPYNTSMKVMLVIPHVSDGGGEKILSDLSCNLKAEIVLVVFQQKFSYPFTGKLISLDLPIDRKSIWSRLRGFIQRSYRFRRVLRQERPDAVISFMGEANLINALMSPRPIVTVHNHLSSLAELRQVAAASRILKARTWFEAAVSKALMGILYRRATVVAVAEAVKRELIEQFRVPEEQIVVIPNAVNNREIQESTSAPATRPWASGIPVVITAGRLTLQKGQWHLIRAFAEARKRIACQLAILGAGELEDHLRGIARELGVERDVFFLGWQKNPFQFMTGADLFVLPSITEGFGLVLLEAMACGVPVVSTDCPGEPREILAPGTTGRAVLNQPEYAPFGVLVPVFDKQMHDGHDPCTVEELQLADVIVRVLQDKEMSARYVSAGLSRVRDFDHAVFLERYQRLIEKT